MDATKDRFVAQNMASIWPAKPLQDHFVPSSALQREAFRQNALNVPKLINTSTKKDNTWKKFKGSAKTVKQAPDQSGPYKVLQGVGSYGDQLRCVRIAQQKGRHQLAIRLTSRALRRQRKLPRQVRKALMPQIIELLNLRSLSLIAVGECGEAWRCISLMSRLWPR